jgi:hypothetical protein
MKTWKPTQAECDRIKLAASKESVPKLEVGAVLLEPGERYNTKGKENPDYDGLNIALITDEPEGFNDTDLNQYGSWADFRKGVRLTDDGRAILDFYIRRRFDEYGELHGNVTVYYADGQIQRVHGYPGEY